MPLAILVTGDRHWADGDYPVEDMKVLRDVLMLLNADVIIQGGASGADEEAESWALSHGYTRLNAFRRVPPYADLSNGKKRVVTNTADWKRYGRSAGPIRNRHMLDLLLSFADLGWDTEVIAFHRDLANSKGTKNMVDIATKAGYAPVVVPIDPLASGGYLSVVRKMLRMQD